MSAFFTKKRVVVTGGAGFLGSFVVEQLRARGCEQIIVPRSRDYDLVEMDAVRRLYDDAEFREERYAPPPLLRRMVAAGRLGRKSGGGFYDV
jgi:nucleoside-diphosphate-sugar epimerase